MRLSVSFLVASAAACAACGWWAGSRAASTRVTTEAPYELPAELGCWSVLNGSRLVTNDALLRVSVGFTCGRGHVDLSRAERPSPDAPWDRQDHLLVTDLLVTDVDAREAGSLLYVAGVEARGDAPHGVLEAWTLDFQEGAVEWTSPPAPPVGEPAPAEYASTVDVGVRGGAYVLPTRRAGHVPLQARRTLVELAPGETIASVAADPEGRFVLYRVFETGAVWSLVLGDEDAAPTPLYTVADEPALAEVDGQIWVTQVDSVGRVYRLFPGPKQACVVAGPSVFLIDHDNDGRFDACEALEGDAYLGSPLADAERNVSLRRTSG